MRQSIRRLFYVICLLSACVASASAEELQEVVYLKNGSVIRGTIIEQVPNQSLKIKTTDGNIFVFKIEEVEKITKEPVYQPKSNRSNYSYGVTDSTHAESVQSRQYPVYDPYGWEKAPRYRGFVGASTVIGFGDCNLSRVMLNTSHGVQIIPELFVGVGTGITAWFDPNDYWEDNTYTSIPVFANIRGEIHNILRKNFSPYLDVKLGYNFVDLQGLFFAPEVGCHFYFGHKKIGLGFGIGYQLQQAKVTYYYGYGYTPYTYTENLNGIAISVAFDF